MARGAWLAPVSRSRNLPVATPRFQGMIIWAPDDDEGYVLARVESAQPPVGITIEAQDVSLHRSGSFDNVSFPHSAHCFRLPQLTLSVGAANLLQTDGHLASESEDSRGGGEHVGSYQLK